MAIPRNLANLANDLSATGQITGSVVQVVNATYDTQTNFTTQNMVDTGLTASITPSSASNKVLVFVNLSGLKVGDSTNAINFQLLRGATIIEGGGQYNNRWVNGVSGAVTEISAPTKFIMYLDSPNTTSSTTYKVQCAARNTSTTVTLNLNDGGDAAAGSTIILMEIAA